MSTVEFLKADIERSEPPTDIAVDEVVTGSNDAGFALLRALWTGEENLILSPASLSIAFAMAKAGADGPTGSQLAEVFGFLPGDATHEAINALLRHLEPDNTNHPEEGAETVLEVANGGWAQSGLEFGEVFLETLARHYGSGLHLTDFAGDTEASRIAINAWVDERTRGLIPELIAAGQLDPRTVYALINALYFKGAWTHPFDESQTEPRPFALVDGSMVDVSTMAGRGISTSYVIENDLTAVSLPYGDGEFEMRIVMPQRLDEFAKAVHAQDWSQLASSFGKGNVDLTIPRWDTESNLTLDEPLSKMGLEIPGGRYPGVRPGTIVSSVIQGAKIIVDELGTEAAAATAVLMMRTSLVEQPEPVEITIDRPFLYTIEHVPTGLVLFVGLVTDPR